MVDIKLYTSEEVAELLKVTRPTIYRYIKEGKITPVKRGKNWYFTEENIKNYLGGNI